MHQVLHIWAGAPATKAICYETKRHWTRLLNKHTDTSSLIQQSILLSDSSRPFSVNPKIWIYPLMWFNVRPIKCSEQLQLQQNDIIWPHFSPTLWLYLSLSLSTMVMCIPASVQLPWQLQGFLLTQGCGTGGTLHSTSCTVWGGADTVAQGKGCSRVYGPLWIRCGDIFSMRYGEMYGVMCWSVTLGASVSVLQCQAGRLVYTAALLLWYMCGACVLLSSPGMVVDLWKC